MNNGSSRRRRGKRDRHALKPEPKVILHALDTEFKIESLFPIMGVIFVGVLAVMARAGFRGRLSVAGIDLGTTNSVVCVQALSSSVGEIECINDPGTGSPLIPSVVSFLLDKDHKKQFSMLNIDKEKEIDVLVGYDAKQRIDSHAHSTIFHSKRFLGRDFTDEAVTEQQAEVEFDVALDIHNTVMSPSSLDGDDGGGVVFRIPHVGGDSKSDPLLVSPESIGSYIVSYLMKLTQHHLGYDNVKSAVIAVPAKFDMVQRQATAQAFKLAGIKVARVLEEPVAAALAYGLHRKPNVDHILVYDFGGGTLDVSILHVSDGFVDVMASEGDDRLGGADFDAAAAHYLTTADNTNDQHVERLSNALKNVLGVGDEDVEELMAEKCTKTVEIPLCHNTSFHTIGEKMKIKLSSSNTATEQCLGLGNAFLSDRKYTLDEICDALIPVKLEMTKEQFDQSAESLYMRSRLPIRRVLDALELQPDEIDEVVMVGGSSRMPTIREVVKEELRVSSLNTHIDPDITVAYGCASVID
eukprot:CAMPEP_0116020508 /NCGR_PEP_ID=MMETSP0321-20121206/9838_1 /TAXON_ID=163516 /ORGANISM="Leptocylindrus danicus var. danicus, Strain B650" /LENGTH=524 /DNA_ID=CAMNT_0003491211 /DNA_START=51 /DNA_END=1625 /DNA_ORIENTATION=+